ncbi:TIGR00725 family protein [candidate division WOR-3 bacterium]|nr:TIGR00725 family protein [candidate division WOR-3 bacterium]
MTKRYVGVIGAGECDDSLGQMAKEVGQGIARMGAILICGGLGGVMAAACEGARQEGGLTVGILPGTRRGEANQFVDIEIVTGILEARNLIIIRTADVLVAIGGSYGTLSEIGFALKMNKPVIGLKTWDIPGVLKVTTVAEVLQLVANEIKK